MSARTLDAAPAGIANVSRRGLLAGIGAGALVLAVGVPSVARAQQPQGSSGAAARQGLLRSLTTFFGNFSGGCNNLIIKKNDVI